MIVNKSVVFVAGDGAPGRIMMYLSYLLKKAGISYFHLAQKGGAPALFNNEACVPECDFSKIALGHKCKCVVIGNSSYEYWRLENVISRTAFQQKIPVIRVFDDIDDRQHSFPDLMKSWEETNKPPLTVTVLTNTHKDLLTKAYPKLENHIVVIGNPLHYGIEQIAQNFTALRKKFDQQNSIDSNDFILSLFISGQSENQFVAMCKCALVLVECLLSNRQVVILLNVHHRTDPGWLDYLNPCVAKWTERGVKIIRDVHQDDMLVLANLSFSSPTATNGLKALMTDKKIIECHDSSFEQIIVGLKQCVIVGVTPLMSAKEFDRAIKDVLSPTLQSARLAVAKEKDLLPLPNALEKLYNIIAQKI